MAKLKLTEEQVREALRQSHGLKTGACEILACNFDTLQRYIARDPEAEEIVQHWRKRRVDRAEYKLDEAIERGEAWAIALILKDSKYGKERGYGSSVDLTADGKIELVVKYATNNKPAKPTRRTK
jgi:hypothetical protein